MMSDDTRKDDSGTTDRPDDVMPDDVMVERDHPQTRKGEPDARGSSEWREDVIPPSDNQSGEQRDEGSDGRNESRHVSDLAEEAERTRRQALGDDKSSRALGGDKARSE
jgi:hypothetical protein